MKSFIIKFILLTLGTLLMTFVLEKDYKVNGVKRVVTNSKYSKIAYYLGLANIVLMLELLEIVYDKYISSLLSNGLNIILSWVVIPLLSVFAYVAVYFSVYSQELTKKNNESQDTGL